ncbi:DUF2304 domain-containing protein [Neomoorella humiferrea]|uniref:DUF2304 domain-containing protein n=1 Tax=Neomoorella humiferrea TaxID=676965 RepID=A0A2T0ANT3_9FIRM|nr:DUF2304 domain-containing protein [Moorella humiferrea]PRR70676.1 hypothetical protein MOHU_17830 [Moorella humiferrea]
MSFNVYLLSILFSGVFLIITLGLVRKKHLKEQYSLMWILVAALMFLVSLNPSVVETAARWLDVKYAPSMLFLFGLVFAFVLTLHLTVVVSRLSEKVVHLTQEVALLRHEVYRHDPGNREGSASGEQPAI